MNSLAIEPITSPAMIAQMIVNTVPCLLCPR
jgi:hypothetical protein